jgi:hypothetical protein
MAERFDLDAIEADDALLDLLAAGGESAWEAGEHDPALKLLADLRLAVEVEDELPVETIDDPESFLARCAALNPTMDPFARKMAARGLALGVAAVAALSVSGVAAAVTGDPLSPYEKVIEKVVDGLRPQTSYPKEQLDGLGLPVADRTKIVKVAKDFQIRQEQQQAIKDAQQQGNLPGIGTGPLDLVALPKPALARTTPPLLEKPAPVEIPVPPPAEPTQTDKPADPPPADPTTNPTTDPTTPPPSDPATTPTTPAPTDTPTDTPSVPPTEAAPPDNGTAGNGDPAPAPAEQPTTAPSGAVGDGMQPGGTTDSGFPPSDTTPAGDAQTQPVDQTPADQSAADQSVADQLTADQLAADQLTADQSVAGQSAADQTAVDQPAAEQPVADQPAVDQPAAEQPVADQPAADQPAAEQPAAEQPAADQPAADQPAADQPAADQPAADQPAADQPAADQPAADQPAGEEAPSQVVPELPALAEEPAARLEAYSGKATESSAKHSSGTVSLGWAKDAGKYAAGRHSSGEYAEGKHAAVTRAHGSMAPVTLRQILQVLNRPTSGY